MKQVRVVMGAVLMLLLCIVFGQAQQTVATATNAIVPPLVNSSGALTEGNGKPLTGVVTFDLCRDQQGGSSQLPAEIPTRLYGMSRQGRIRTEALTDRLCGAQ